MAIVQSHSYLFAWLAYLLAGLGCCLFWWKITSFIHNRGWRDVLRGATVVLIFTPWFVADSQDHYAPAFLILLMDVLLEGVNSGLKGGVALLVSSFILLAGLALRQFVFGGGSARAGTADTELLTGHSKTAKETTIKPSDKPLEKTSSTAQPQEAKLRHATPKKSTQ